jgi:hypothetical protein
MAFEAQMEDWFTRDECIPKCFMAGDPWTRVSGRARRPDARGRGYDESGRSLPILGAWTGWSGVDNAFYGTVEHKPHAVARAGAPCISLGAGGSPSVLDWHRTAGASCDTVLDSVIAFRSTA